MGLMAFILDPIELYDIKRSLWKRRHLEGGPFVGFFIYVNMF